MKSKIDQLSLARKESFSILFTSIVSGVFLFLLFVFIFVNHFQKEDKPMNSVNYTHAKGDLILQHVTVNGVDCVIFQNKTNAGLDCGL
jgi:type II secretory pathway component PulC